MAETRPTRPAQRPPLRSWRVRLIGVVLVVALIAALALVIDYVLQITVTIAINGQSTRFRTHADTVRGALEDAGLVIDPEDIVWPALDERLDDGDTITVRKAFAVALQVDAGTQQVHTQATHPLDILAEQGITLEDTARVQINGQIYAPDALADHSFDSPPTNIRVIHSTPLILIDGDRDPVIVHTTQTDVGRTLDAAGLALYLADRVTPDLSTAITPGLTVRIERSLPVTVIADGHTLYTRVTGATVADALLVIGLAPIGQDYTIPDLDAPLLPEMTIQLVRVTEALVTKDEPIPYITIYQPDATMPLDEKHVVQEGIDGLRTREILVRYEDGEEVSREVQQEWIVQPPTPRMIVYGERVKQP